MRFAGGYTSAMPMATNSIMHAHISGAIIVPMYAFVASVFMSRIIPVNMLKYPAIVNVW